MNLGIIMARGGSKRIPLKNIKLLNGQPLISYSIKAALKSQRIDRLVISTDHAEIARIARECGADVPFTRPAELAEDVPSELVSQHAVRFVEQQTGIPVNLVITMQPTTPFVQPEDIDACIKILEEDASFDSAITVKEVSERPEWMFHERQGKISPFQGSPIEGETGVFQSLPKLYHPNGAVYVSRRSVLMEKNRIIGDDCGFHLMSREHSVDIDEPIDFEFAELLARRLFAQ
ncbi:acylneuraminate cytidylyltransferase family protein [Deltaproteobacteria bacterium TL4]